jgi:hypothetical protein
MNYRVQYATIESLSLSPASLRIKNNGISRMRSPALQRASTASNVEAPFDSTTNVYTPKGEE